MRKNILKESVDMKKKLDEKVKKQKGITLIALIVSVLVILILASVSIAMLTGENGILTKATTAKEKTAEGQKEENIKLSEYESKINETIEGTSRDNINGTKTELYKLNNPTWQPVNTVTLSDNMDNYKTIRIDFISCWWENTTKSRLIGNIFLEPGDISNDINWSYNYCDWYLNNVFTLTNNSITFSNGVAKIANNRGTRSEQTINVYRVVGYK